MTDNKQVKKGDTEACKKLKTLLVIYDYVRSSSTNIDEFNNFKIFLNNEISRKTLQEVFLFYKNKTYTNTSSDKIIKLTILLP